MSKRGTPVHMMKHEIHVLMNSHFRSKKQRSDFIKKYSGKYHVGEMTDEEVVHCLEVLKSMKIVLKPFVRERTWAELEKQVYPQGGLDNNQPLSGIMGKRSNK